jgi:hypothetical protein
MSVVIKPDRNELVNALVNRFIDNLSVEDAMEYIANDMTNHYNRMTIDELLREMED